MVWVQKSAVCGRSVDEVAKVSWKKKHLPSTQSKFEFYKITNTNNKLISGKFLNINHCIYSSTINQFRLNTQPHMTYYTLHFYLFTEPLNNQIADNLKLKTSTQSSAANSPALGTAMLSHVTRPANHTLGSSTPEFTKVAWSRLLVWSQQLASRFEHLVLSLLLPKSVSAGFPHHNRLRHIFVFC